LFCYYNNNVYTAACITYSAPPDPVVVFKGPTFKTRKGEREEWEREWYV